MQPKTEVKFDPKTFARLKRTMQHMSQGRQRCLADPGYASPLPLEIGLQLTNRCNLRCRHCFQWTETGWHRQLPPVQRNQDLDFDLVAKIVQQTATAKPNLYLWGGEPLSYGAWEPLARLLEDNPLWTVLCTNGIDLGQRMESVLRIGSHLAVLVSLDGPEAENDALRGAGSTRRVLSNLDQLLRLKREGSYCGEVSLHCVIHEAVIPRLYDFVAQWEDSGINTVYLCFPWYISPAMAARMDDYYMGHFAWLRPLDPQAPRSWHSFQYHLPPELAPALQEQIGRITERVWRMRVRLQPALEPQEIAPFILGACALGEGAPGQEAPAQQKSLCLAVSQRMNVLPDGTVTACKLFPEFVIGDLHQEDVRALWHKPAFRRAREVLHQGLMPACSRCVLLYLHGS
jgi:radical SAM protein with 4Fe4S-binding SPASM domain